MIITPRLIRQPTRREFLKYAGMGAVAFGVPLLLKIKEAHAATTYFGNCNSDGTLTGSATPDANGTFATWNSAVTYTCPSTGDHNVTDLSAYCKSVATTGLCKVGVYSSDGTTLKAYVTSAETVPADNTLAWRGAQSAGGITQNAVLIGGTNYIIFAAFSGANMSQSYSGLGSSGDYKYEISDYTTTLPSSVPTGSASSGLYIIRVGVEAVGGGGAIRRRALVY